MAPEGGAMDDEYYELPDVLFEELQQIEAERGDRRGEKREKGCDDCYEPIGADKESRLLKVLQRLHGAKLAALCFSGGGIRSATFNLGILQGLAKNGVLKDMDYLSQSREAAMSEAGCPPGYRERTVLLQPGSKRSSQYLRRKQRKPGATNRTRSGSCATTATT